jgi:aspartyl-tRNA(Asn)/glutamyl-tRNA(Gln) amidotransferase subunit B
MADLEVIIGLEVHAQMNTKTKLFCGCDNDAFGREPNTTVCEVCMGHPGTLPVANAEAIAKAVTASLAIGCTVNEHSHFDRKHYFYPDLPSGFQISQYDFPIAQNGHVDIDLPKNDLRPQMRIGITRAHLEEDAAKNIHDAGSNATLVDYNRASVPLLEIVTEPDFRSPLEAKTFLQELQALLRAVGTSEADMEKGYMRCDANVSLLEVGDDNLPLKAGYNPKIEIKNLNSFRSVERALAHEIERQGALYANNEIPVGATRGWNENEGKTFEQRLKETSADYRYFPEPDLPPLSLADVRETERGRIPELPAQKRFRLMEDHGFSADDARFLVANEGWADYAENVMGELASWLEASDLKNKESGSQLLDDQRAKFAKLAGGWLTSKLAGLLAAQNKTLADVKITPEDFAEFLHLLNDGTVGSANAQKLLALMLEKGTDPSHLMEEHDLGQTSDPKQIAEIVTRLIEQNPDQVKQVKEGKLGVIKWFVGCVMKATEGKANPTMAEEEVKKQLAL